MDNNSGINEIQYVNMESWDSDSEDNENNIIDTKSHPPIFFQSLKMRTLQIEQANSLGYPVSDRDFWLKISRIIATEHLDQIHDRLRITSGFILGVSLAACQFLEDIYLNDHLLIYKCPVMEFVAEEILSISWQVHKILMLFKKAGLRDKFAMDFENVVIANVRPPRPVFTPNQSHEFMIVDSLGVPQNLVEFQKVLKKIFLTLGVNDVQERIRDTSAYIDGIVGSMKEFIENIEENKQELLIYKYMETYRLECLSYYAQLYELSRIFKDCIPENIEI